MTATKPAQKAKTKPKKSNKKKLTLSLNQDIIERGKFFAKENGISLSALIEQFLRDKIKEETYIPIRVIEPDAELGALFPARTYISPDYDVKRDVTDYYDAKLKEYHNREI